MRCESCAYYKPMCESHYYCKYLSKPMSNILSDYGCSTYKNKQEVKDMMNDPLSSLLFNKAFIRASKEDKLKIIEQRVHSLMGE